MIRFQLASALVDRGGEPAGFRSGDGSGSVIAGAIAPCGDDVDLSVGQGCADVEAQVDYPQERVERVAVAGALGIDAVSRDEQNSKGAAKPVGARQNQRGRIGASAVRAAATASIWSVLP